MTWDVATAKLRLGITTDTQDAALQSAMNAALAVAETYCDRRFMLQDDEQEFTLPVGPNLLMRRYPLKKLLTLKPLDPQPDPPPDPVPVPVTWLMDKKHGIVFVYGVPPWLTIAPVGSNPPPTRYETGRGFVLSYTGGYDPLPADLEMALWFVFDQVWSTTPGWGKPAGSTASDSGVIKSFAIDGMKIDYDAGVSAGSVGAGRAEAYGLIPANAIGVLDAYRAESAALGG